MLFLQQVEVVELRWHYNQSSLSWCLTERKEPQGSKITLTSSLYFIIVLFLALVSTQVTKSSVLLVTSIAGSVTGVGPTRIWPCSIVRTASETVSDILRRATTTARRRRAMEETVTLFSMSEGLEPMSGKEISFDLTFASGFRELVTYRGYPYHTTCQAFQPPFVVGMGRSPGEVRVYGLMIVMNRTTCCIYEMGISMGDSNWPCFR